jgi:hypothetical protein
MYTVYMGRGKRFNGRISDCLLDMRQLETEPMKTERVKPIPSVARRTAGSGCPHIKAKPAGPCAKKAFSE